VAVAGAGDVVLPLSAGDDVGVPLAAACCAASAPVAALSALPATALSTLPVATDWPDFAAVPAGAVFAGVAGFAVVPASAVCPAAGDCPVVLALAGLSSLSALPGVLPCCGGSV